jgi:hypothetical protein
MPSYFWVRAGGNAYFIVRDGDLSDVYVVNDELNAYYFTHPCDESSPTNKLADTFGSAATFIPAKLAPGQFHKRMWRGQMIAGARALGMGRQERDSVRVSRMLAARLQDIFHYIEPEARHDVVYGHEVRSLLILACTEVENSCKAVLRDNGAAPTWPPGHPAIARGQKKDEFNMYDYSRLADPMKLAEWEVSLSTVPTYGSFRPFDRWKLGSALDWYSAYNKTKHDRELSLCEATLGRAIRATAAVFVLTVAQFGGPHRDIASYFRPDEFLPETPHPTWPTEELYLPPIMDPQGTMLKPGIPLGTGGAWTHVDYPF